LQHNDVIILMVMRVYLKNFNQRINFITTALVRIHHDILKAVDDNKSVILLLLDLSATFDTVDLMIMVSGLAKRFGIRDMALNWFRLYLQLRKVFLLMVLIRH